VNREFRLCFLCSLLLMFFLCQTPFGHSRSGSASSGAKLSFAELRLNGRVLEFGSEGLGDVSHRAETSATGSLISVASRLPAAWQERICAAFSRMTTPASTGGGVRSRCSRSPCTRCKTAVVRLPTKSQEMPYRLLSASGRERKTLQNDRELVGSVVRTTARSSAQCERLKRGRALVGPADQPADRRSF